MQNRTKILVLSPHLGTRIWVCTMIGLLKKPLWICQSGWKEIWKAPPVICWIHWGPEKGSRRCFTDVTNWGSITSAMQATCTMNKPQENFCVSVWTTQLTKVNFHVYFFTSNRSHFHSRVQPFGSFCTWCFLFPY